MERILEFDLSSRAGIQINLIFNIDIDIDIAIFENSILIWILILLEQYIAQYIGNILLNQYIADIENFR